MAPCEIAADFVLSGTSIECTLSRNPVCGEWIPNIVTTSGTVQANGLATTTHTYAEEVGRCHSVDEGFDAALFTE